MTRAEVQEKIKDIIQVNTDPNAVKVLMANWLKEKEVSDFDTNQIINDLTSYKEYLNIMN